jgi:enoyl-CoA hydratase/carnithine racemase
VVGPLKAAELMLTGTPMTAREAYEHRLVSKITPVGEQLTAAHAFVLQLEGTAPEALRATKRLLRSQTTTVPERMAEEGEVFRRQLGSPEFAEAARAFMERRKPVFSSAPV